LKVSSLAVLLDGLRVAMKVVAKVAMMAVLKVDG
jgi:hypothetical protein